MSNGNVIAVILGGGRGTRSISIDTGSRETECPDCRQISTGGHTD